MGHMVDSGLVEFTWNNTCSDVLLFKKYCSIPTSALDSMTAKLEAVSTCKKFFFYLSD